MATRQGGFLGRVPGDTSVVIAKQVHQPTGVQTDFTFASGYTVGYCDAYLNGVRLISPFTLSRDSPYIAAPFSTI